jgi:hypothetical protein
VTFLKPAKIKDRAIRSCLDVLGQRGSNCGGARMRSWHYCSWSPYSAGVVNLSLCICLILECVSEAGVSWRTMEKGWFQVLVKADWRVGISHVLWLHLPCLLSRAVIMGMLKRGSSSLKWQNIKVQISVERIFFKLTINNTTK